MYPQISAKWLVTMVLPLCLGTVVQAQSVSPGDTQEVKATPVPSPLTLPEFGERGERNIRVIVQGQINRPGVYFLAQGASVHDAIQNAQGPTRLFDWGYASLIRLTDDGQKQVLRFSRKRDKAAGNEQMILREGDVLQCDHEVY